MTLVTAWLLFPLVLGVLCLGCGLLLEAVAGVHVAPSLLLPTGFAVIAVATCFTTSSDATAELTAPLVVCLAVAGLALRFPWRGRLLDRAALASAAAVFAVYAAPVVASGEATFAGYIKLDDDATFLAIIDRVLEHGRSLAGLAPSTYEAILDYPSIARGYPLGSLAPLGAGAALVGQDPAWVYQPYLAFLAALLALTLYALVSGLGMSPLQRGLLAFVAAQPALLYAYSLWGGIKEVAAAALLALVVAFTPQLVEGRSLRGVLPAAVAVAAFFAVVSLGGGVWLLPLVVPFGLVVLRAPKRGGVFVAVAVVLALPTAAATVALVRAVYGDVLTGENELANLIAPLNPLQLFGIWPVGDFRLDPDHRSVAVVLALLCAVAAVVGVVLAWRRGVWQLPLYAATTVTGAVVTAIVGSPWVEAKGFAIASPAVVLAGLAGCVLAMRGERRVAAVLVALAIAGGVLWSNALAYHEVNLAPRDQLAELEVIGERFAGQGPALMTEFQPYGVRHFLRRLDPEGASELRRRIVPLRAGGWLGKGEYADLDAFRLDGLLVYRTLVLRRSPVASRPPAPYRRVWQGRFYEVWARASTYAAITAELPLGSDPQPGAVASCAEVRRLARRGGTLVAQPRAPVTVVDLDPGVAGGDIETTARVPSSARYAFWVGGSVRGRLELLVDGRKAGAAVRQLNNAGQWLDLGEAQLAAGPHRFTVRVDEPWLSPGSGGPAFPPGPLVLEPLESVAPLVVPASQADVLCGRRLDWIEVLSR